MVLEPGFSADTVVHVSSYLWEAETGRITNLSFPGQLSKNSHQTTF